MLNMIDKTAEYLITEKRVDVSVVKEANVRHTYQTQLNCTAKCGKSPNQSNSFALRSKLQPHAITTCFCCFFFAACL